MNKKQQDIIFYGVYLLGTLTIATFTLIIALFSIDYALLFLTISNIIQTIILFIACIFMIRQKKDNYL